MPLSSALFRGNRALEACAVQDSAHVTHGAQGEHVAKIQFALFSLDRLLIANGELARQQYGASTAAAVLAYKRKRAIINRSYQSAPDDIVGKMTIASLDTEMRAAELRPQPRGDCVPSSRPGSADASSLVAARGAKSSLTGKTTAPAKPLRGAFVRILLQITQRAELADQFPLAAHLDRARNCLGEHGMSLSVEFARGDGGFADRLPFSTPILSSDGAVGDNVNELRKASEDARPGLPGVLRVIVCQMIGSNFGDTFRGRVIGGRVVPPFCLLNSQLNDLSHATLIHEMIHASKGARFPHDDERASVFFDFGTEKQGDTERTFLKAEHAATLATMSSRL